MQKVITINLNGRAYALDEDAYDALRAYLDNARLVLKDNPDLTEIMADLEQAIGEKCQKFLGPNKTVVTSAEVAQVLAEMGPVDSAPSDEGPSAGAESPRDGSDRTRATADAPRRLYRIHEGAWIGGVCTGIAAYLNVDVVLVRVAFVVLAVATKGPVGIVTYLFLMFVLPDANTSEEHAAAHGAPFNAKEIVDQATSSARQVATQAIRSSRMFHADWRRQHRDFRREWQRERRAWKRTWRQTRRDARSWWGPPVTPTPGAAAAFVAPPIGYAARVVAGFLVPVLALASAAFFWIWAAAMMSLLGTGAIFGRPLPADLPMWAAALILVLLFNMVAWPLQHARNASHVALGGRHYYGGVAAWDGMMGLGFWLLCGWAAYRYFPEVNQFMENLPAVRENLRLIFRFG